MNRDEFLGSTCLTPPGVGGVAVLRVTGSRARENLLQIFQSRRPITPANGTQCIYFGKLVEDGETLDEALVIQASDNPSDFDVSIHGGVRLVDRILQAFERLGAAFRSSGECTLSLWPAENLIEREALDALPSAKCPMAVRFLLWQRCHLPSYLEALARLCEEDATQAAESFKELIARAPAGRRVVKGGTVALVGPPNGGKSTLFNRLTGRAAAVVSPHAGTTRDWIAHEVLLKGLPVTLIDTAGRRTTANELEQWAIAAGSERSDKSDLELVIFDGSLAETPGRLPNHQVPTASRTQLTVLNKQDLGIQWPKGAPPTRLEEEAIVISAENGFGVEVLIDAIIEKLGWATGWERRPTLFSQRQAQACSDILSDLVRHPAMAATRIRDRLIGKRQADGAVSTRGAPAGTMD